MLTPRAIVVASFIFIGGALYYLVRAPYLHLGVTFVILLLIVIVAIVLGILVDRLAPGRRH